MEDIQRLLEIASAPNLVTAFNESDLNTLGERIVKDFETDLASRSDWDKRSEKAMEMALQVAEKKTFPWPDAANVKLPLLTVAALQFHARCYPAVVQGSTIVKGKVTGEDPSGMKTDRAERISKHMNYQLTEEMCEWEEQMDAMLLALPIEGCEFKKTYYCSMRGRNVSEWIRPGNFVVNYSTKSLNDCPRATHIVDLYPHQIAERKRSGVYIDVDLSISTKDSDEENLQKILEQHRLEDLDGDGVKEPYIFTVHKESKKILRIKANWEPTGIIVNNGENVHPAFVQEGAQILPHEKLHPMCRLVKVEAEQYFTKYSFIPSPDGGFYDVGFGQLVGPMAEASDSIINRLLDSGTLSNLPMGFIDEGIKLAKEGHGTGKVTFKPGEFKKLKRNSTGSIRDQIYEFSFREPSVVLFQLLGLIMDQVSDITSVKDIMVGGTPQNETATTTMARIEQGLKVFSAIYKRIYRALHHELRRIYRLNGIYLPIKDYFMVVDSPVPLEIQIMDYQGDETDIQPIADPSIATTMQRMAKAQLAMQLAGNPHVNPAKATKMLLDSAELPQDLFVEQPPQAPPDPKLIEVQAKVEKMAVETQKMAAETQMIFAQMMEMAKKLDLERMAEQTARIKAVVDAFEKLSPVLATLGGMNDPARMAAVEGFAGNQGVPEAPAQIDSGIPGIAPLGAVE